jgi:hypothetical protein
MDALLVHMQIVLSSKNFVAQVTFDNDSLNEMKSLLVWF